MIFCLLNYQYARIKTIHSGKSNGYGYKLSWQRIWIKRCLCQRISLYDKDIWFQSHTDMKSITDVRQLSTWNPNRAKFFRNRTKNRKQQVCSLSLLAQKLNKHSIQKWFFGAPDSHLTLCLINCWSYFTGKNKEPPVSAWNGPVPGPVSSTTKDPTPNRSNRHNTFN